MFKRVLLSVVCVCLSGVMTLAQAETFFPAGADVAALSADAPYTARFAELGHNRPLAILLYDLETDALLAGVDIDKQMPVVSAIKGPILMYFLSVVPDDVWDAVPTEYWPAQKAADVAPEYRAAWESRRDVLRDLYRMIVVSDNVSTGNSLLYAAQYAPYEGLNPIQKFNQWSADVIGVSSASGLREWDEGATKNPAWIETRFNNRTTLIRTIPRFYNNMYSSLDLARYYHWLYTQADDALMARAREVMSIVPGFPGFLEDAAQRLNATPVSKDGFVGPDDRGNRNGEYLTADAGMILLPEGGGLIVVTMGVNGGDKLEDVYHEVQSIVRRGRQELYWPASADYLTWIQSADGPYGANTLSSESAYFVMSYLTELNMRPQAGQTLETHRPLFDEALAVWLAIFPDDRMPTERTAAQNRIIAARYGGSGERVSDIARDLGLVD